jgi:hypothetical protein
VCAVLICASTIHIDVRSEPNMMRSYVHVMNVLDDIPENREP